MASNKSKNEPSEADKFIGFVVLAVICAVIFLLYSLEVPNQYAEMVPFIPQERDFSAVKIVAAHKNWPVGEYQTCRIADQSLYCGDADVFDEAASDVRVDVEFHYRGFPPITEWSCKRLSMRIECKQTSEPTARNSSSGVGPFVHLLR